MDRPTHYTGAARLLHWAMALLLFAMLLAGLTLVRSLEPWQPTLLLLHKSFGLLALVLAVIRLIVRLGSRTPALPGSLPSWQVWAAKSSHVALYAAMFALPVSGYLMQNAAGRPITFFEGFTLPALIETDLATYGLLRTLHGWFAWGFMTLIFLHIGAALQHGLIRRDGVLRSMIGR
ncbi:cytochrome b561 [Marinimicrobium koreense]|uniref:Cytochrome b561 n=1 Tax=Marinimicrobium koreense TaxID=306545 RepID=A0A3N1P046_9GAMM|nr:cytochrome b [Marinimicrobium koreense]ROQ21825.1 cytochrome b561 [Marinimicrobium koreense]